MDDKTEDSSLMRLSTGLSPSRSLRSTSSRFPTTMRRESMFEACPPSGSPTQSRASASFSSKSSFDLFNSASESSCVHSSPRWRARSRSPHGQREVRARQGGSNRESKVSLRRIRSPSPTYVDNDLDEDENHFVGLRMLEARCNTFILLWHRKHKSQNKKDNNNDLDKEKEISHVFLVLDSDHRTICSVLIGPQMCSCGSVGPCVHLLFVLVLVFGLSEDDELLLQPRLHDDDVRRLLARYVSRGLRRWKDELEVSEDVGGSQCVDVCPLCLKTTMTMMKEKVSKCVFCHTICHSECLRVWQCAESEGKEQMSCPLAQCRLSWRSASAPSLLLPSSLLSLSSSLDVSLPRCELLSSSPSPPSAWLATLGRDVVACALSKDWASREAAMRHVQHLLIHSLDLNSSVDRVYRSISEMLSRTLEDRVLKVFSAAISTLRVLAIRLASRADVVRPVLKTPLLRVVVRCADNNRRVSDLSTCLLLEMCVNMEHVGSDLVLTALLDESLTRLLEWPQALGRLVFLNRAIDLDVFDISNNQDVGHLRRLADFALLHLQHPHVNVAKLASRLFVVLLQHSQHDWLGQEILNLMMDNVGNGVQADITRRLIKHCRRPAQGRPRSRRPTSSTPSSTITPCSSPCSRPTSSLGPKRGFRAGRSSKSKTPNAGLKEINLEESMNASFEERLLPLPLRVSRHGLQGLRGPQHVAEHLQMATGYTEWTRGALLGTGAFSACYSARDKHTGVLMAVKELSVDSSTMSEVWLMSQLRHPHVVAMLGATLSRDKQSVLLFLEWMAGGSVAMLLDVHGAFTEHVVKMYTRQLLLGLHYIHSKGILHRDLKGGNLLVDASGGHLRIADFGAAISMEKKKEEEQGDSRRPRLEWPTGSLQGTIAFMAPEVLRGERYEYGSDIWSTGCCIVEMTTAKPPWDAPTLSNHLALIFKIGKSCHPPRLPSHLSPMLTNFALQCLNVSAQMRPTAHQLLLHPLFNSSLID